MFKTRLLGVVGAGLLSLSLIPGLSFATSAAPVKQTAHVKAASSKKPVAAKSSKQTSKHVSTASHKSAPVKSSRHQVTRTRTGKHQSKHSTLRTHGTRHTTAHPSAKTVHSVKPGHLTGKTKATAAPVKKSTKKPAARA